MALISRTRPGFPWTACSGAKRKKKKKETIIIIKSCMCARRPYDLFSDLMISDDTGVRNNAVGNLFRDTKRTMANGPAAIFV